MFFTPPREKEKYKLKNSIKDELNAIEIELQDILEDEYDEYHEESTERDFLTRIEGHFVIYDPVFQEEKLRILREKIIYWEGEWYSSPSLNQKLRLLLTKEERKLAAENRLEERKLAAENRFIVFEEYRRLSYDLNIKDKIDGSRICEANVNSDYDFIVEAPDNDNNPQKHYAKRLKTTDPDLVPFILIPMDKSKPLCEIKLTFQGTSSINGWYRNFTGQGSAGINEFNANKVIIIFQLMQEIKKIQGNKYIDLSIIGHSLGGADAQNIMVEVMRAIDQGNPELSRIRNLSLYVYNSAGIIEKTRLESLELAKKMKNLNIKIDAYFSMVGGDIVQQVGEANIFVGLEAEYGSFTLVKTNSGLEGIFQGSFSEFLSAIRTARPGIEATISAHTGEFFTSYSKPFSLIQNREYFFNDTFEGLKAIQEKCGDHKFVVQGAEIYAVAKVFKNFTKTAGKIFWESGNIYELLQIIRYIVDPGYQEYFIGDAHFQGTEDLIKHILSLQPKLWIEFFERNLNGTNFFIECVKLNRDEIVELLCKLVKLHDYGYRINIKDNHGKTALAYAVENGFYSCFEMLRHYAEEGEMMMMLSARNPNMLVELISSRSSTSALFSIVGLAKNISRGKQYERGNTIFHYLAESYHADSSKIFTEILFSTTWNATSPHALLCIKNDIGKTPVDYLKEYKRIDIISTILEENKKQGYLLDGSQEHGLLMFKEDIRGSQNGLSELPESPNPIIYSAAGQAALSPAGHRVTPTDERISSSSSSSSSCSRSSRPS